MFRMVRCRARLSAGSKLMLALHRRSISAAFVVTCFASACFGQFGGGDRGGWGGDRGSSWGGDRGGWGGPSGFRGPGGDYGGFRGPGGEYGRGGPPGGGFFGGDPREMVRRADMN